MAGTSGCIPDYEVNLYGQLCKSTLPPAAVTTSESEPQDGINGQVEDTPMPQRTALATSEPDPNAIAFQKYQHLIRGFSGANAEAYLATVKEVFAEVRRDRMKTSVEQPQEQHLAKHEPLEQHDEQAAKSQNQCQNEQQKQHPAQQGDQHQQRSQRRRQSLPGSITQTAPSLVIPQAKKDARRPFSISPKRMARMPCIACVLEKHEKRCDRRR